jgi:hypothetical protein
MEVAINNSSLQTTVYTNSSFLPNIEAVNDPLSADSI